MLFLDDNKHWQFLTNKRIRDFLAANTLREKFGELNILNSVISLGETPSALERITNGYRDVKNATCGSFVFS